MSWVSISRKRPPIITPKAAAKGYHTAVYENTSIEMTLMSIEIVMTSKRPQHTNGPQHYVKSVFVKYA